VNYVVGGGLVHRRSLVGPWGRFVRRGGRMTVRCNCGIEIDHRVRRMLRQNLASDLASRLSFVA
jgi:hypothetical protein